MHTVLHLKVKFGNAFFIPNSAYHGLCCPVWQLELTISGQAKKGTEITLLIAIPHFPVISVLLWGEEQCQQTGQKIKFH